MPWYTVTESSGRVPVVHEDGGSGRDFYVRRGIVAPELLRAFHEFDTAPYIERDSINVRATADAKAQWHRFEAQEHRERRMEQLRATARRVGQARDRVAVFFAAVSEEHGHRDSYSRVARSCPR